MLAAARGAALVPTVPDAYQPLRREVDRGTNVDARMCLYLSALFTAAEQIQCHLAAGIPVVVESYFARCLANHRALGAQLEVTLPPGLPQPVTYELVCAEDERRRRLAGRNKPITRWDVLSETVSERTRSMYARFPMHQVDTTSLTPDQVLHTILAIDSEGDCCGADEELVGAHSHLLPSVPLGS
jgi:acyl-CoA hydrolase